VRQSPQHHLPLVLGGEVAQQLSGEGVCSQAGGEERRDDRKHARR
jgi:hypothetical protein